MLDIIVGAKSQCMKVNKPKIVFTKIIFGNFFVKIWRIKDRNLTSF